MYGAISGLRYARKSFIPAKVESDILAPLCYTGTCDTKLFNTCLKQFLIPELKAGQVVIMDNASFHKSQETQQLIEQAACKVLYSPDLNPIEIVWANFKKIVQANLEKLETLAKAIDFSLCAIRELRLYHLSKITFRNVLWIFSRRECLEHAANSGSLQRRRRRPAGKSNPQF